MRAILVAIQMGCGLPQGTPTSNGPTFLSPIVPTPELVEVDCAAMGAFEVVALDVTQPGDRVGDREITAILADPASTALVCVNDQDHSDAHLLESPHGTEHRFRMQGLLADASYDCGLAPTCPVGDGTSHRFTMVTGAHPLGLLPKVRVDVTEGAVPPDGYLLTAVKSSGGCGGDQHLVLYDLWGDLRWWSPLPEWTGIDVEVLPSGHDEILWGGGMRRDTPQRVSLWHDTSWTAFLPDDRVFHHDAKSLPDGRLLTLELRTNRANGLRWDGFGIRIHDPIHATMDWEYDSQQGVDAGDLRKAGMGWDYDPYHANWVDRVETSAGPMVYVSLCNSWRVIAIDEATGDIVWRFGAGGDFDLIDVDGLPLDNDQFPQCQHGMEITGNGTELLVYDNGRGRGESRVVAYTLDMAARTATLQWQWTEPGWRQDTMGDVDWLPDGDVLVTQAVASCWDWRGLERSKIVALDPETLTRQWEVAFLREAKAIYRSEFVSGCQMLASTRACPTLADRLAELRETIDLP